MIKDNEIQISIAGINISATIEIKCLLNDVTKVTPITELQLKYPVVGSALIGYKSTTPKITCERIHNVYKDGEDNYFIDVFGEVKRIDDIEKIPIRPLCGGVATYTVNTIAKRID